MPKLSKEERVEISRRNLAAARLARMKRAADVEGFVAPEAGAAEGAEIVPPMPPIGDPAPVAVVVEPAVPEPTPAEDAFGRFLATLDADTRELLDDDELLEIFNNQMAAARADKRAMRKKAVTEQAKSHARIETGAVPQSVAEHMAWQRRMDEKVVLTVRLPYEGAGHKGDRPAIYVDQMRYMDGETYTVPRKVAQDLLWQMYAAHQHQAQFEGRSSTWYGRSAVNGYMSGFGSASSAAGRERAG